jgi:hypothetical protein
MVLNDLKRGYGIKNREVERVNVFLEFAFKGDLLFIGDFGAAVLVPALDQGLSQLD